ncbi:zinc finger protein Xfin-like isoform X2 [Frieseomelitta varia]|uniref:zinc finger protein Xfin-like isoform X2 n=1 Tax=Frieseomelitta varia TaxID=561572 RepID=UPI001CB687E6|nr:zinc finger protein Xfin-like isoform X2 [Frieseomelitta varia]
MLTCKAHGCLSNESTKIDGKDISLFCFPKEADRRNEWIKNCQISENIENDKPFYLCELHFDKSCFTDSKELIPNAAPTIFNKVEENQRKRKAEDVLQTESLATPVKQKRLDSDSHSLVVSLQSPCTQLVENVDKIYGEDKMDISDHETSLNESANNIKHESQKVITGKKLYRLTIQVDKIYGKPCPRSKKLQLLTQLIERNQQFLDNTNNTGQSNQSLEKINRKAICAKGGCKLKKSIYDSKPAFQCEYCDKYYIMKKSDNQDEKNICTICHKNFSSSQSLCLHTKTHFICDMCQTECSSQMTYDKHIRLHVSTDPLHPYKCHQCTETFELKEDVRQHYLIVHPTIKLQNTVLQVTAPSLTQQVSPRQDYRCVSCNITFRNEQAYRNHTNSHKKKEGLRCSIGESTNNIFPMPSSLTGSQIGILRAVKFSCRVCSMEFDNVGEVDIHTRTHLEADEERRKCNICKRRFKTSKHLDEHLKYHPPREHSCPVCSKPFINRTNLEIHLRTHNYRLQLK